MNTPTKFFATCPKNLEGLLEDELISLGASETKQTVAGVNFTGDLALAYRACLWSRLANRILLPLSTFNAEDADALYDGINKINWLEHLNPEGSLVVDFAGVSEEINNSHFGALRVKDAIVDQIRERTGKRPSIDKEKPDLRVNLYLYHEIATVSVDLSGDSLHRRAYRTCPGAAPLKENLAAAILYRSKWPQLAKLNKPLFDPMCGSGTILIEAAMIAQDYAPGLLRESFGFTSWIKHDRKVWEKLLTEAKVRHKVGKQNFSATICGCDVDLEAISMAESHIASASLEKVVKVTTGEVKYINPAEYHLEQPGIIVTNPPYGERLQDVESLHELYSDFGKALRENFINWEMAMLVGNPDLGKNMGIRSHKSYNFFNGTIPCKLLMFRISPEMFWREYKGEK
ncbi:MAG: bifunctional 23S rRNA (guanine(2069)-N(7))-methyltransferase RlmK/23S rRNA (guanine(2445)-N(2))-methyltransferase RlmL [Gammaproteobacteria bacterium]|nr:bifunctional 23S rRNA (guanine(2069)-N(7))-methyltransferase RlmK/23S rRNA (guanine(2445)-N(2))-methyltransferase RlmL [Gammaproteobacteria bacterium]